MEKVLILFAHPRLERSKIHNALLKQLPQEGNITFHDLYERYPDFNVDVDYEKRLLEQHKYIIMQHPFYWYSCPPLLKQWIDMVLEFGWAYGPGGDALTDKVIFNCITTGGAREAYQKEGYNRYTIKELLAPIEQTARLCKMIYLPPFAVQGTHKLSPENLEKFAGQYKILLGKFLQGNVNLERVQQLEFLNDICVKSSEKV